MLQAPERVLRIGGSESTPESSTFWSFFKSVILPILLVVILVAFCYILYAGDSEKTQNIAVVTTVGIVVVVALAVLIWNLYLDRVYEPEVVVENVEEAPAAASKVYSSSSLSLAGLLSLVFYKFFNKRNDEQRED